MGERLQERRFTFKPMTTMRKEISKRLLSSHLTSVPVTITMEVDMTEAVKLRQKILSEMEENGGVRVSFTDLMIKAVAEAIKSYSIINSTLEGDQIKIFEDVHIGVAVALEKGLIVPVVRDVDKKTLVEIASTRLELVEKARKETLSLSEVTGGTFTITNLGMYGVDVFTPIINPPQAAILGVGRIVEKPVVRDGKIIIRSVMTMSLTHDHRITDGGIAAKFLQRIKQILENPSQLFEGETEASF